MNFQTLIDKISRLANDTRSKGSGFERLMKHYFKNVPPYSQRFSDVWLWQEWPGRDGQTDSGIDLVAWDRDNNGYCAIQCKFYDPKYALQKKDIDSFFTASGKMGFTSRLVVSTTDKWSQKAEEALSEQQIPVARLGLNDLLESPIDWDAFDLGRPEEIRVKKKKEPHEFQKEAIHEVIKGLETHDHGKLIMACGTGKTYTSYKIGEKIASKGGFILFLVPSISLMSQTLKEWSFEANVPLRCFAVCSDTKIGKDNEDLRVHDLAYPATTNVDKLTNAVLSSQADHEMTVIFSTYQSIQVIIDAQGKGLPEFDLIICDEAHRTTGLTLNNEDASNFVKVHKKNGLLKGKKRLYMTATPRIFSDKTKKKADEHEAVLYSMDDMETFGPVFYQLNFGEAVSLDKLTDYKVLILAVKQEEMSNLANQYKVREEDKKALNIDFVTKIIGSWKGLSKQNLVVVDEHGKTERIETGNKPMQRAVAFTSSIKRSEAFSEAFENIVDYHLENSENDEKVVSCDIRHVDGKMNALKRQEALQWLRDTIENDNECRILSNARCLSEGVDVPALDSVIFFDTRDSIVDIVQSVGRVMRKAEGKDYGYIILPVRIPSKKVEDYNTFIESDPQFKGIWKVLKALRAHDESLVDEAEFRRKIVVSGGAEDKQGDGDGGEGGSSMEEGGQEPVLDIPRLPIDQINEAVYAVLPKKLGDREYWSEWAQDVAVIAQNMISRIEALLEYPQAREIFDGFLKEIRDSLNPNVSETEAVEMLAQHALTKPIFEALFTDKSFVQNNPVSRSLQSVLDLMTDHEVFSETEKLEKFYDSVRERVKYAKSDRSKQDIIRNLYDTFFQNAFPRMSERLGIVYTPVEVVDFINNSVAEVLKQEFGKSISDENVHILDPFTGTGTFIVRLLQKGLIDPKDLPRKYKQEIHANELVLLAYYIATLNIESTYHGLMDGDYEPFEGIVLTDTFQMAERSQYADYVRKMFPTNTERAEKQRQKDIKVIIGNPPYSSGEKTADVYSVKRDYPSLDKKISQTYVKESNSTLSRNLYDHYIRAIRWASDRIGDNGVIGYVTNGSFLDANNMDGLRKSLYTEFSSIYCFNLRGNQRTSGELSRKEGGKIFGSGSRAPICITLFIKNNKNNNRCRIWYHDIGDYLKREDKLNIIEHYGSINKINWTKIAPNEYGDWVNQRDEDFEKQISISPKDSNKSVFNINSLGISTNRDAWVYNFSKNKVINNVSSMIHFYNDNVDKYIYNEEDIENIDNIIIFNPHKISWSSDLKNNVKKKKKLFFSKFNIILGTYRPFYKQYIYYSSDVNDRQGKFIKFFPKNINNVILSVTGVGAGRDFSTLISRHVFNLDTLEKCQCFPLYWYESLEEAQKRKQKDNPMASVLGSHQEDNENIIDGYIRHDAITDWSLSEFHSNYKDTTITKEDIFYYVYGILHSPEYREKYQASLKKMLPRIPFATDFWMFSKAGRALAELHLNYETVKPYPLEENWGSKEDYTVKKMEFAKKGKQKDKTTIIYNSQLTLSGIPLEAYEYEVNGRSAIEWIMESYRVKQDKNSGIVNDPNDWLKEQENPRYIVDLIKSVVTVSLETMKIVKSLPSLEED